MSRNVTLTAKIYQAKAIVTVYPYLVQLFRVVHVNAEARQTVTLLNTRVFGWEAANRIFVTFSLFAQQVG